MKALHSAIVAVAIVASAITTAWGQEGVTHYVRYTVAGDTSYGILEDEMVRELDGDLFAPPTPTGRTFRLSEVRLLAPIDPSTVQKVLGVAINTRRPGRESPVPHPRFFAKLPTSLGGPDDPVELPPEAGNLNYEGELVLIIGREGRHIPIAEASDYVFGVTVGDDFSENTWYGERQGVEEPTRLISKGTNTWAPIGPAIVSGIDYSNLAVETRLNGEVVQRGRTSDLVNDVPNLISYISRYVTLKPGDVIFTGTVRRLPDARRVMQAGDVVEVEIEKLGVLRNSIVPMQTPPIGDPRIEMIRRRLDEAESNGLNGTILIRNQNRVLLHRAYGFADREAQRPMSVSTGFDIGSLVKPITAATVLKLEELGKLSTSDTLGRFFPSAPLDKRGITIMQVLMHTAGMRDVFGSDYQVVSREWLLDKALNASLIGAPGERERYSNSGYSLLAMIIEDVTGRPYEEFVREQVLEPAGVRRIGYVLAGWKNEELAVGYRRGGARWGTPLDHPWADDGPSWNLRGNGGMLSTAEEMARWYEALFDGKIIGPAALEKYYGFDAGRSRSVGGKALAHAGGNGIFNTFQVSFIDRDFHLTFFTSTAGLGAEEVWRQFRDKIISLARGEPPEPL